MKKLKDNEGEYFGKGDYIVFKRESYTEIGLIKEEPKKYGNTAYVFEVKLIHNTEPEEHIDALWYYGSNKEYYHKINKEEIVAWLM